MADIERVDLAIWDVTGEFQAQIAAQLVDRQVRRGPKIVVTTGRRSDKWIAIGSPQRLTAASRATIAESLGAVFHAHRPGVMLVVGPASASDGSGAGLGAVRVARRVVRGDETFAAPEHRRDSAVAPDADFAETARPAEEDLLGVDWGVAAIRAMERVAVPGLLLGVVTHVDGAAPVSRRPTVARATGRWIGSLLSGKKLEDRPRVESRELVRAMDAVLHSI